MMFDAFIFSSWHIVFGMLSIAVLGYIAVKMNNVILYLVVLCRNVVWAFRRNILGHTIRDKHPTVLKDSKHGD